MISSSVSVLLTSVILSPLTYTPPEATSVLACATKCQLAHYTLNSHSHVDFTVRPNVDTRVRRWPTTSLRNFLTSRESFSNAATT